MNYHEYVILAKNRTINSLIRLIDVKNDAITALAARSAAEVAINKALQQSLDEATARIDLLTTPDPTWNVGDMARHKRSGNAYTITALDRYGDRTFARFKGYESLDFNLDFYERV